MSTVQISSNGYKLAGNLFVAGRPSSLAFLFIQGWMGHQNVIGAQALADLGFSCLTYDMHGNGESEGNVGDFSRAEFLNDAENVYDYFKQQLPKGTKIGLIGSSFGSYMATLLSTTRSVSCMSLRVPATYPDEGFTDPQLPQIDHDELVAWRKRPMNYDQNMAFQALHDFDGPVMIIESGADIVVPHQACQNYAQATTDPAKLRYEVIENAPHSFTSDSQHAEYGRLLASWATSILT